MLAGGAFVLQGFPQDVACFLLYRVIVSGGPQTELRLGLVVELAIKPTDHSIRRKLSNLGDVGQVDFTIRFCSELLKLLAFLRR